MKSLLVTGGAGFIGSNFVHYILRAEPDVKVANLDLLTYAGNLENLQGIDPKRHSFIKGDIGDEDLVADIIHRHHVDTIVHFAAESHVDRSIYGPAEFMQTNVMGTFALLEVLRKLSRVDSEGPGIRFHHVSTDEVFGSLEPDSPPFDESTPYAPRSPYAASKAASDHLVRAYARTFGLEVTISNCSNNYGPYQFPEKLVPLVILNALEGLPLPIYGDGKQIRDWLFVEDHCEAIHAVLKRGVPSRTYLIGGHNQPTNIQLVTLICDLLDEMAPDSRFTPHSQLIKFVADRPGHDRRYEIDTSQIEASLGWTPKQSLRSGLTKTIAWYLENQEWLESVRRRPSFAGWIDRNYNTRQESS